MQIANIGDFVKVRNDSTSESLGCQHLVVDDVAFLDDKFSRSTAKDGKLYYYFEEGNVGWLPASYFDIEILPESRVESATSLLGQAVFGWMEGLEARPDNQNLIPIITYLLAVQYDKEGYYGSSWKGKGEYRGIMSNIDRKYDRLDKIVSDEVDGKRPKLPTAEYEDLTPEDMKNIGESKIDAVADLANYCNLYMTWLEDNHPGAFRVWVAKNVPQYLREKIPFISR